MNTAARIIITLGSGIAAFALALIASSTDQHLQARTPLYLIAALLQPTGILIAIDEFFSGGDWRHAALITSSTMALQQAVVFWKNRDTTLLFTTLVFVLWLLSVVFRLLEVDNDVVAMVLGCSIIILCIGLEQTPHRTLTPFWFLAGSSLFYGGLGSLVLDTSIEILFLVAACGGVLLSAIARSRSLLVVSTLAILGYVSYFTSQYFLDSMGWPFMLMLLGLLLIALGSIAVRINRRYIASD